MTERTAEIDALHYCGYPDVRREPTLCGIDYRETGDRTTTRGADVTCPTCAYILDHGVNPPEPRDR